MSKTIKSLLLGPGSSLPGDLGLLILRAGVGLMIAFGHGRGKLFTDGRLGPSDQFISGVAKMGMPMPTVFAWCAALAEFLGGLLLALGLLTRPAALALTINMLVAIVGVHLHDPVFKGDVPGYKEPALLYLLPFLTLLLTGPGRFSLDRAILGKGSRTAVAADA